MVEHGGRHMGCGPLGRWRANTLVDVHVRVVDRHLPHWRVTDVGDWQFTQRRWTDLDRMRTER